GSMRCRPRITTIVFAIFVDGIEQETAVGVKAISEWLTVDKILRRLREEFRDERGEGRSGFAVAERKAFQCNRGDSHLALDLQARGFGGSSFHRWREHIRQEIPDRTVVACLPEAP